MDPTPPRKVHRIVSSNVKAIAKKSFIRHTDESLRAGEVDAAFAAGRENLRLSLGAPSSAQAGAPVVDANSVGSARRRRKAASEVAGGAAKPKEVVVIEETMPDSDLGFLTQTIPDDTSSIRVSRRPRPSSGSSTTAASSRNPSSPAPAKKAKTSAGKLAGEAEKVLRHI